MGKNIIIVLLLIVCVAEAGYIIEYNKKTISPQMTQYSRLRANNPSQYPPAGPNARGRAGAPLIISKGVNLKQTPLFKYAYQIAPGTPSARAKKVMTGFSMTSKSASDGSEVITLMPKDATDQSQVYTLKTGQILYYIEQTPVDDKADLDKDLNYRDDYGIITDSSGIV